MSYVPFLVFFIVFSDPRSAQDAADPESGQDLGDPLARSGVWKLVAFWCDG